MYGEQPSFYRLIRLFGIPVFSVILQKSSEGIVLGIRHSFLDFFAIRKQRRKRRVLAELVAHMWQTSPASTLLLLSYHTALRSRGINRQLPDASRSRIVGSNPNGSGVTPRIQSSMRSASISTKATFARSCSLGT